MNHKGRVKLTDRAMDMARELLGANPTPARLERLLERMKEAPMPLDEQDRDLGRRVHKPSAHAELLNQGDPENLDAALSNLAEADQRRSHEARERLGDRIAANRAMGLDPNAPPIEEVPVEPEPSDLSPLVAGPAPERAPVTPSEPSQTVTTDAEAIEAAKRAGIGKVGQVAESLERRVLQQMPNLRQAGRSLKSLEDAAELLIAELDLGDQDAIRQVMAEHSLANWVVVLGAVKRMADLQELNAGEFSDAWVNRQSSQGTAPAAKEEICEMCGGKIPPDPVRRNRRFCCNRHGSSQVEHTAGCALASLQMVKGKWVTVPVTA